MMQPVEVLQKYWGYPAFRPLQEDIIQSILEGNDTLALLPTGGGKSICYQVPGLIQSGLTIVVTPLIALMRDQVRQLKDRKIPAIAIHSGLHFKDIDRELNNCVYGNYKFLYLSPERLQTEILRARLPDMKVSQLIVDEAHCISQWGFDFRPSYLRIAEVRELLPGVPCMALTATATRQVRGDITVSLKMENYKTFVKTFKRDNISFFVIDEENKLGRLLFFLKKIKGTKIIYVRNRRKTRELSLKLEQSGFSSTYYHAGLDSKQRAKVEAAFIRSEKEIIVSTNAFGMGIDKADVRAVFHLDLPTGPEEYYQEAGRAGRDGRESYAILFCRQKEKDQLLSSTQAGFPSKDTIKRVYKALCIFFDVIPGGGMGESFDFNISEFTSRFNFSAVDVFNSLKIIERSGYIHLSDGLHHPAKVMIEVNNETLYDYQLKNPALDPLIKAMLRAYEGLFSIFVAINLNQIAKQLKTSVSKIHKALLHLEKEKIVTYIPASDLPRITFTQPRAGRWDFKIDSDTYDFLKKRTFARVRGMIAYTEEEECRMLSILHYFDEKGGEKCGKCDLCRGMHIEEVTESERIQLKAHLLKQLSNGKQTLEHLLDSVSIVKRKKTLNVLKYLEAEQWIEYGDRYFRLKKGR